MFSASSDSFRMKKILRPEQKLQERIRDLFSTFCRVEEQALEACAGTLASTKACLYFREHRKFVDPEKHFACFQDILRSLAEV